MLFNESTELVENDLLATASQLDGDQVEPQELDQDEETDEDDAENADDSEEVNEDEAGN